MQKECCYKLDVCEVICDINKNIFIQKLGILRYLMKIWL